MKTTGTYDYKHYKLHVTGTLAGTEINKKYSSLNQFIREFGGVKTPLNLNKYKVIRLRRDWVNGVKRADRKADPRDTDVRRHWGLTFTPINEPVDTP